jgi:hypothetical protein
MLAPDDDMDHSVFNAAAEKHGTPREHVLNLQNIWKPQYIGHSLYTFPSSAH